MGPACEEGQPWFSVTRDQVAEVGKEVTILSGAHEYCNSQVFMVYFTAVPLRIDCYPILYRIDGFWVNTDSRCCCSRKSAASVYELGTTVCKYMIVHMKYVTT